VGPVALHSLLMRVALTGGIASGKSTVADYWADLGAVIVDADVLSREVAEPGTPGLAEVVARFGESVIAQDGALDRATLAAIVFNDQQARQDLEAILHPRIRARAAELEAAAPPDSVVVHVIPLLVETGRTQGFDAIVVVDVAPEVQLERTMARDGSTGDQAAARIAAQASRESHLAVATHVIDNSGDEKALLAESLRVWHALRG
jgi:dephospho-CoA kinase